MTTAELVSATERAVLERVRTLLARLPAAAGSVVGIRASDRPEWHGATEHRLDGRSVRVVACPSVLAVLAALAEADGAEVTVVFTDQPETELGDAVLARLFRGKLLEADRYTLLNDLLDTSRLDPRVRKVGWLVDALVELAGAKALSRVTGTTLSLDRAISRVAEARLGFAPDGADLPGLVAAFDGDPGVRARWRQLDEVEQVGITDHLRTVHGPGAAVLTALAATRDDVVAELLVAQAVTAAPASDVGAAVALGAYSQSRFPERRFGPADLAAAGAAAVTHVRGPESARTAQQIRRAETLLDQLHAAEAATSSPVLPRGFVARLVQAAEHPSGEALAALRDHRAAATVPHRVDRVVAAARLTRWLSTKPSVDLATPTEGVARHAQELAWVDRALDQIRAGDAEPRVADVLGRLARQAGAVRAGFDRAFADRLAVAPDTPERALAVETLLPAVVAPLAARHDVLLVVVDGMSGAVASGLVEELTGERSEWAEVVRSPEGRREAVLAALPTETRYSRTSLFSARLAVGEQPEERAAFAAHRLWPGGALLVHKSGVAGREGADLGRELEEALGSDEGRPRVVGVVLNAVDESLKSGPPGALDPEWQSTHVNGLPQLLDRAATAGRIVVLTSDHGHVLEHGSTSRGRSGGGARWRPAGEPPGSDEVLVAGPRVLTPDGRAVLAATEDIRYGKSAHGYHGGATLAECAIPLAVLVPPGVEAPQGWHPVGAPPAWWTGTPSLEAAPVSPVATRQARKPTTQDDGLFDLPAPTVSPSSAASRGTRLVGTRAFQDAHAEVPANRVPGAEAFVAVIDALATAGGRLPTAAVLAVVGGAGRNPRGLVAAMARVLNRDSYPVLTLVDGDRAVVLDLGLLDEQFPAGRS